MSLWHTEPVYHTEKPCTHVLIFGTSVYSGLPDNPGSDERYLGLTSVTTPAISAYRFAQWIKNTYQNKKSPLGSIRLLLSPSQTEIDNEPELLHLNQPKPNRDNVKQALYEWRQDCAKHRDGYAILYAAGHGVRLLNDTGIVLLEDFGKNEYEILDAAVDIGNIHQAMAQNSMAKNQFYFVDACAIEPDLFRKYISLQTGIKLSTVRGESVESSPIFFGAAPETLALAEPGKGTLFIQALIKCLDCDAAVADDVNNPKHWQIYTQELFKKLRLGVNDLAQRYGETQSVVLGGLSTDSLFHQLKEPPKVPLSVALVPETAEQYAHYKLTSLQTSQVIDEQEPFHTPRIKQVVPGVYRIDFNMQAGSDFDDASNPALIVSPPLVKTQVNV